MTKEKWTYLMMGIGSGIILSGILMVCMALEMNRERRNVIENYEKQIGSLHIQLEMNQKEASTYITDTKVIEENIQIQEDAKLQEDLAKKSKENYKWVDIPHHYGSGQIVVFLEKEGIVADADDFHQYLINQKQTKKLRTGNKFLPELGEYETILTILLGKNNE